MIAVPMPRELYEFQSTPSVGRATCVCLQRL